MGLFSKAALKKALAKEEQIKKHTILIVDDEEHNLVTLADLLSDDYNVLTASNGLEALEMILNDDKRHRIHLIISDQRMPKMTGVEFLSEIIEVIPKAKRILLTGYTDVEAIIDSINKGQIYKFVLKPFDHRDMMMTIKLALDTYELETQNDQLVQELKALNTNLERKVSERTEELQEALQELSELNTSKDRFFSVLAHDLKNPLHAFILTAETIVEDIDFYNKEQIARLATNLYRGSQNLYRLLENLLYWAQRQLEQGKFYPIQFDVSKIAEQSIDIVCESARSKDIQLVNEVPEEARLYADENMVEVILRNLLSNAIKFSHPNSEIHLRCEDKGEWVVLSVQDRGVGIDEEGLSKLFRIDKHFTTRGTKDEKGTGLGLILCKELVQKNDGEIWVESEPEQGTTFFIKLPKEAPAS